MKLRLQRQPNRWSCLPTAFAIALDVKVETVLELIGHDGSEIIFDHLIEPYNRRSFHIQELIDVCFDYGYTVTQIEKSPTSFALGDGNMYTVPVDSDRLSYYLSTGTGVLVGSAQAGTPHAAAWDGEMVLDPNGTTYKIKNFNVELFFLITKINITRK